MRSFSGRKAFAIVSTGILGAGLISGVALAASPETATARAILPSDGATVSAERPDRGQFLARVLAGLVEKGVITQDQAQQIVRAVAEAAKDKAKDHAKRRFAWNAMREAIDYLGIPAEQVREKLAAGATLGQIADALPGKSRDGLIRYLGEKAEAAVAEAVADGKLTAEQAREALARMKSGITTLADKVFEPREKREPTERSN